MIAIKEKSIKDEILEGKNLLSEAQNYLKLNGVEFVLDEWLSIKRYCDRFDIKDTQIVTNWIKRGIIPVENVRIVEELNGLRLIKAVPYKKIKILCNTKIPTQ